MNGCNKLWLMPAMLLLSFRVMAHQPVLNEQNPGIASPYQIEQPEVSKAIFATLTGNPHYYRIDSDVEFDFYAGITVAKLDNCDTLTLFSFDVLDAEQRVIATLNGGDFKWRPWYEKFGKKWYWIGPEYGNNFKSTRRFAPGTYYIRIYNRDNRGNYVLATGDQEKFGPLVIMKMMFVLPKINRRFWEEPACPPADVFVPESG